MNKRTFLKNLGVGAFSLGIASWMLTVCRPATPADAGQSLSTAQKKPKKYWSWARPRPTWTDDEWKAKITLAREAGINALLLEVYNGNHTYFEGGQLPMKENELERISSICHASDMEFHAWMWTMPLNNPDMIKKHPDWFAVNGLDQPAHTHPAYVNYYKFMCPCHPEVQEYVAENVASLARIPEIDGVHLDYVRLPDVILAKALQPKYDIVQDREYAVYDYSYSTFCREQFKAQTGIDPLTDLAHPAANSTWRQFRYDAVSNLVNKHLVPEAKKHNKIITAAVFPNWESVRQAWHTWDLDAFLPMLYHNFYDRDLDFIKEHTEKALSRMRVKKPVYSGLFIPAIEAPQLDKAIHYSLQGGSSGAAFFDFTAFSDVHWKTLKGILQS